MDEQETLDKTQPVADLFHFDFAVVLTFTVADRLRLLTGMRIGDLDNPYKDTPGRGEFAGDAQLFLGRGERADTWSLDAFTDNMVGVESNDVERMRAVIIAFLDDVAIQWSERRTCSATSRVTDGAQRSLR
jgi:hypothetical protein